MIEALDRESAALLWTLATSAIRSFLLAGVAAAGLAAFRGRATSVRLFTWTSVLYASLGLPLLAGFLPPLDVRAPEFVKARMTSIRMVNAGSLQRVTSLETHSTTRRAIESAQTHVDRLENKTTPVVPNINESTLVLRLAQQWKLITAATYLVLTLFFLWRLTVGIVGSRKLLREAELIADPLITAKLGSRMRHHVPQLAASDHIYVPLTVGAFRTTILLPANWRGWDGEKLHVVLTHELSHVERGDGLTQRCALLYRAIFWFNPFAWWLNRHLAMLGERASDEAVLSGGANRKNYAKTLLDFLHALQTAPGRIRWEGVSLARAGQAEQRVERILEWKGSVAMKVKKSLATLILALSIPVVYLAAAVRPAQVIPAPSNADIAQQPGTSPAATAAAPIGGVSGVAPVAGVPTVASTAPVVPVAPVAPMSPIALAGPVGSDRKGFSYHYGFDDKERFVIVSGKTEAFTMSGTTQDARHVEKLKKQITGDFIWFQRDEKSYIIRDQATVDRARGLWAPPEELGRKQEELGKQQEELGRQQEELGNKMEQVRVNMPDMTAELDRLKAKLQKLGPSATMEQVGDLQSEIGELQSKLGEIQSQAGEQQGKLGEQQGALGEKQGKLGEQQGELGRQQAELAEKATAQMKELLDQAIKNGTAKPEEEMLKNPTL